MDARLRAPAAGIALAVPLITGLAVLLSGYGLAWDFLNYHYYDGYALFHDRSHDIAPAGLHTYFNPTAEIPFYLGVTYLPMPVVGFLFGFFSGLNFPLVFFLSRKVLQGPNASLLAFWCALFAISSANFAIEIDSVNHDNLVSLFFLAGLIPLFYVPDSRRPLVLLALAGGLIGVGVGLKLTLAPFLVATCAALPLLNRDHIRWPAMPFSIGVFAAAALIGLLIPSAWWMLHLWHAFGNPLFPMFNNIFRSHYAAAASYSDHRFLPHGILEWIAYPLFFTFDYRKAGINMEMQDYRYLAAYIGFVLAAVVMAVRHFRRIAAAAGKLMKPESAWFLIALAVTAYILWEVMFGVSRYLLPFDLLLPLVVLALMQTLGWTSRRMLLVWILGFAALTFATQLSKRNETRWTQQLTAVRVPPIPDGSTVVMAGSAPLSYLIPGFPPHVSFVRIGLEDGFSEDEAGGITAIGSSALLATQARQAIAAHKGNLYVLFSNIHAKEPFEHAVVTTTLNRLHLQIANGSCRRVFPVLHYVGQTYALCALRRL